MLSFKLLFSCVLSCVVPRVVLVARDSRGSNISLHTCQPQFSPCKPHANLHTGTHVAHHARLVPLPMLAQMLHPCKTRANSGPGTDVATLARLVPLPMLAQMLLRKKRANCWTNVGPGEGVDLCFYL